MHFVTLLPLYILQISAPLGNRAAVEVCIGGSKVQDRACQLCRPPHLADLGSITIAGGVQELVGALRILPRQRLLHHAPYAQQICKRLPMGSLHNNVSLSQSLWDTDRSWH
jgi:hypothetical protein